MRPRGRMGWPSDSSLAFCASMPPGYLVCSSPPFLRPCYFGTDIPEREQLIAYNRTIEEIRDIIGADSLGYLGIDRLSEMADGLPIC